MLIEYLEIENNAVNKCEILSDGHDIFNNSNPSTDLLNIFLKYDQIYQEILKFQCCLLNYIIIALEIYYALEITQLEVLLIVSKLKMKYTMFVKK